MFWRHRLNSNIGLLFHLKNKTKNLIFSYGFQFHISNIQGPIVFNKAIFLHNQRNFLKGPLRLVSQLRKETNLTENCHEINKWLGPQFDEEKNMYLNLIVVNYWSFVCRSWWQTFWIFCWSWWQILWIFRFFIIIFCIFCRSSTFFSFWLKKSMNFIGFYFDLSLDIICGLDISYSKNWLKYWN